MTRETITFKRSSSLNCKCTYSASEYNTMATSEAEVLERKVNWLTSKIHTLEVDRKKYETWLDDIQNNHWELENQE